MHTGAAQRNTKAASAKRSFATVQDTPVRRYGGLKDQDRIFTNVHSRHDHGIKGAMVCCSSECRRGLLTK
jgi:NADH dehydrogenase (ubiquinone) flavoprotein 1